MRRTPKACAAGAPSKLETSTHAQQTGPANVAVQGSILAPALLGRQWPQASLNVGRALKIVAF